MASTEEESLSQTSRFVSDAKEEHLGVETSALRYAAPLGGKKGAILRSLPVLFVLSLVALISGVYLGLHVAPLLGLKKSDTEAFARGAWQCAIFVWFLGMFLLCFFLCATVPPGGPADVDARLLEEAAELKASGERRACKWCGCTKPARCHHCRVCRSCVLRMDHHCPWVANCVGWGNYKFFLLTLGYGGCLALFVEATVWESVLKALDQPQEGLGELFLLLLCASLDALLLVVLGGFTAFHVYLLVRGMTTIEFCEKRLRLKDPAQKIPDDVWNLGFCANFTEAFGKNPLLWFFPIDNREGDGVRFVSKFGPLDERVDKPQSLKKDETERASL